MLKKINLYIILSALFLQIGGLFIITKTTQVLTQIKMDLALNNSRVRFQNIHLSQAEYKKSKINQSELEIDGRMYDIKQVTITGDSAEIVVLEDLDEVIIRQFLSTLLHANSPGSGKMPIQLLAITSLLYLAPLHECTITLFGQMPVRYGTNNLSYHSFYLSTEAPPPKKPATPTI